MSFRGWLLLLLAWLAVAASSTLLAYAAEPGSPPSASAPSPASSTGSSIHQDQQGSLHIRSGSGNNQSVFVNDVDVVEQMSTTAEVLHEVEAQIAALQMHNSALQQDVRLMNASLANVLNVTMLMQQRLDAIEAERSASPGTGPGSAGGSTTTPAPAMAPAPTPSPAVIAPLNNGTKLWTTVMTASGTATASEPLFAYGVAVDNNDFVYVAAQAYKLNGEFSAGDWDMAVVKFDASGKQIWSTMAGLGTSKTDTPTAIATDSTNNLFVTGYTYEGSFDGVPNAGVHDMVLVKLNNNGVKKWSRQIGSSSSDRGFAVAVDKGDNVFVGGVAGAGLDGHASNGLSDAFIVKYDNNGNKLWSRQFGSTSHDTLYGLATDSSDNIIVSGWTLGGMCGIAYFGGGDMFVAKFTSNGTELWCRHLGTDEADTAVGVAVDSADNIYVGVSSAGDFEGFFNIGLEDTLVLKFDSAGNLVWSRRVVATTASDVPTAIAVDHNGFVHVTGTTKSGVDGNVNAGGTDIFVVQLDSAGTVRWVRQYGSTKDDYPEGLAVARNNRLFVAGYTGGSLDGVYVSINIAAALFVSNFA